MTGASPTPAGDPFDALGDPNRRAIVELLGARRRSVRELADALPISRPAVSRHLRLLKEAGLVVEEPRGTRRDLPPPRRGRRGGPRLPRTGLGRGRGTLPARRREHDARAVIEPIRLAFEVACPADHAFDGLDRADRAVVAGRPHGLGRGRTGGRPRAAPRRPDLRADAPPASSTTGARSRSGSRRAGSSTCGTSGATAADATEVEIRFVERGDGDDARRDRASRLGGARRRGRVVARPERRRLGDPAAALHRRRRRGVVARRRGLGAQPAVAAAANDAMSGKVASGRRLGRRRRAAARSTVAAVDPDRRRAPAAWPGRGHGTGSGRRGGSGRAAGRSARRRPRSCARPACSSRPAARSRPSRTSSRVASPIGRTGRHRSW